jgi:endonuclease/exonuclease/phosphatase family metal-dependent hydrolase
VSLAEPAAQHASEVVSVLTLNLWHDSGPYLARRALVREWIGALDPDVIGFQEALRAPGFDQVRDLLDGTAYHVEFAAASPFWRDRKRAPGTREATEFGNAIASRWPISERDVLVLPDNGDGEMRCALSVTVAAPPPVGAFSVTCTHLHWKFHHSAVRERQVVAACDRVLARRRREAFPPLLIGDFNAEPESAEIRYVTGLQSLRGRSVALLDAWRAAGKGGSGITWSNANDYARMGLEPDRRIDYVFAGFPRRDGIGQITECRVVCNEPKGGVWPSDHFGVYAELRAVPLTEPPPFDDAA